ncbi:hypothetical protein HDV04_005900 [Boothiomyces sp. JEL0838]|nr:hypothetical protein HDV04_005900 [Boothiomyces sp. JEL0838]
MVHAERICFHCKKDISGPYMRSKDLKFHLECFNCQDCNEPIADQYFSIQEPNRPPQFFCELDYFRRKDLLCTHCTKPLRGPYISTTSAKYHEEHFCCVVCDEKIRSYEQYLEHEGQIYCEQHFFLIGGTFCAGCNTFVSENLVEEQDAIWHPSCFMLNQLWGCNVKVANYEKFSPKDQFEIHVDTILIVEKILSVLSSFEEINAELVAEIVVSSSLKNRSVQLKNQKLLIYHVGYLLTLISSLDEELRAKNLEGTGMAQCKKLLTSLLNWFSILVKSYSPDPQDNIARVTAFANSMLELIKSGLHHAIKLYDYSPKERWISRFLENVEQISTLKSNGSIHNEKELQKYSVCQNCKTSIDTDGFTLNEWIWHEECFRCVNCFLTLSNKPDKAAINDGLILCQKHATENSIYGVKRSSPIKELIPILTDIIIRLEQVPL